MAPEFMDELEDEVLLRIRPDDPTSLVRAALACKRWRRLILDDPDFRRRRRERELHRAAPPPMLGFACNLGSVSEFVPASTSCAARPRAERRGWRALDARHGRVLLHGAPLQVGRNPLGAAAALVVWDPVADERRELPRLPFHARADNQSWNAALLCVPCAAVCCRRPFAVVLVGSTSSQMFSFVYSSEADAWHQRTYPQGAPHCVLHLAPSALVRNALYFLCRYSKGILKYNLDTREISVIALPDECNYKRIVLVATEDGRLGFITVVDSKLFLCSSSTVVGVNGDVVWAQSGFIDLKSLLPVSAYSSSLDVVGFADGVRLVFLWTVDGIYSIDLMNGHVKKVYKETSVYGIFPCMSFCTQGICAA